MEQIQRLCKTIDRLVKRKAWDEALAAAAKLWRTSRDAEIPDRDLRVIYARTLFKVGDLFLKIGDDAYEATHVFRRAYDFAGDEHHVDISMPSIREGAAHQLARLYEEAKCRQSAVFWFRRALVLARARPVQDHLLVNLYGVAFNLEPLAPREAKVYYDEILDLLWPTANRRLLLARVRYLLPAAMYHVSHGDKQLGENVMRALQTLVSSGRQHLPQYVATGLYGLGRYYLGNDRLDDAIELAHYVTAHARRFGDDATQLRFLMNGLIARAALRRGDFEEALAEIGKVFDLDPEMAGGYGPGWPVEILELWIDVARIRAHHRDFVGAASAYETLAQALGCFAGDGRTGATSRARLTWVQQQAEVVHELVSVWLTVDDPAARQAIDLTVANALLQLKANLFLALAGNRISVFRNWEGVDKALFDANRRFAAAARRIAADAERVDATLDLEDALFAREDLESRMVASPLDSVLPTAGIFHYDFRDLGSIKYAKQTLIDYSLVKFHPPKLGLAGPAQGRRYVGVRLSSDGVKVVDLGSQEEIDALSAALISEVASRPVEALIPTTATRAVSDEREITAKTKMSGLRQTLSPLADRVYRQVIEPLEPLSSSVVIAPDGSLAAVPFHALVRAGRYLIEDFDLAYSHSLLQEESRARSQGLQISIDVAGVNEDIVLLGNPDYSDGFAAPLPGTAAEVDRIAGLLMGQGYREGDIHKLVGPDATVSRMAAIENPRVLHLAAHGSYLPALSIPTPESTPPDGYSWRRWDDRDSSTLSDLDRTLLRAVLVLSNQAESHDDPAAGRLLTALELSSLNLAACRLVVLSACETGTGQPERGAGVLGFQYALMTSFAHASLVSLWSVPDRETSGLMSDFYRHLITTHGNARWDVRQAYLTTLRHACRKRGQLVHPYYWAAFVLLGSANL